MPPGRETVRFALNSSVRSDILAALDDQPRTTESVLEALDASTSAVYSGLGELEEHGLLRTEDDVWHLTGSGRLLADLVTECDRYEQVFGDLGGYLQTHDTASLPREFRLTIGALAGATVLEATETEPHRAVTEVSDRIDAADSAKVVSPIYIESYEVAMPDVSGSKLLINDRVARLAAESDGTGPVYDDLRIRVTDVEFALGVTDSELLLSLPLLDGDYDARSEVLAEHDRAIRWGEDLFESVWEEAVVLEAHESPG